MGNEEKVVDSWEEFQGLQHNFAPTAFGFNPLYAFRGHANEIWELKPSLYRQLELLPFHGRLKEEDALKLEGMITDQFRNLISPIDMHARMPNSSTGLADSDYWLRMQHFRAPTRLLDWTKSIYVALYFAVSELPDNDGAVWVADGFKMRKNLDMSRRPITRKQARGFDYETIGWYETYAPFDRLIAQQGLFTFSTKVLMDHHEAFLKLQSTNDIKKIVIPAARKQNFMEKLVAMNITAASLFPGLDGIGRSVSETLQLEMHRMLFFIIQGGVTYSMIEDTSSP